MATGWILTEAKPGDLKNHPVNIEVYGTAVIDSEMLASVKQHGVIEPCRVTKDGVLLSGHRRRQCAVAAKLKTIPILRASAAIGDQEQIVEIVESNRQREKTTEQKAREYGRLAAAMAEIARERQSAAGKSRHGNQLRKNFSEAETGESGRAKAQAAAHVGMSRPTAEKAAAVVEKIDELAEAGEVSQAESLRKTLNTQSVAAAARAAGVDQTKTEREAMTDEFGPVSQKLESIFADVTKFTSLVQRIGKLRSDIEELQRADSGAAIPINECLDLLKELQRAIKFSAPYCECPKCRRLKRACETCGGLRWIDEPTFRRCRTPDDDKWLKGERA